MDSVDEIMLNLAKNFTVRKNRHRHLARGKNAIRLAVIFWPSSYIGVRVELLRKKERKSSNKEQIVARCFLLKYILFEQSTYTKQQQSKC